MSYNRAKRNRTLLAGLLALSIAGCSILGQSGSQGAIKRASASTLEYLPISQGAIDFELAYLEQLAKAKPERRPELEQLMTMLRLAKQLGDELIEAHKEIYEAMGE